MEETEQDHRHFEEAAPIYATGGLEPKEREEFEAHLETGCSVCFDLLKELQPTSQFEPDNPDQVHFETLQKIPEHETPSYDRASRSRGILEHRSQNGLWPKIRTVLTSGVLALVLVGVAAGSLWYAVSGRTDLSHLVEERQQLELDVTELNQRMGRLQGQIKEQAGIVSEIRHLQERIPGETGDRSGQTGRLSSQVKTLTAKLAEKEKENGSLLREITKMTEYEAFVLSSRLQVVPFVGKRSFDARAFFFYDPETSNALFYGTSLPPLPPHAVYQIWALIKQPVSLGTFKLDEGRNGRLWLHDILKLAPGTKFAVSVERGAGSPKPTGEIYLLGEMKNSG